MEVKGYEYIGKVKLGMSQSQVESVLGSPNFSKKNRGNELEYHYENLIVRFDPENMLVRECTAPLEKVQCVVFDNHNIDVNNKILNKLLKNEKEALETYGIIVFRDLGITLTGFSDPDEEKTISIFRRGDWDDELKDAHPVK